MKRLYIILQFAVAVAIPTAFAEDTIVFKNGDVLTGTIITRNDNSVQFSSGSFGTVSLKMEDIKEIRSEKPEAEKPEPAPQPQTKKASAAQLLDEMANTTPETVPPAENPVEPPTAKVAPPKVAQKEKSQWSGQAGLSLAMRETTSVDGTGATKEETFSTYRLYGHINWEGERNRLKWNWTYRYSEDETRKRDDFMNITQRYNRDFNNGYYGEAKTVYQRDYNRNIDNEFLQTAEVGRKWFKNTPFTLSTSIGAGYHLYERDASGSTANVSEPKFIFDESLKWKLVNTLTLFQRYTHLGDANEYHFVFSGGLENMLVRELFLRLEYRVDRDTDTAYDDKGFTDRAFLTSLLYKF